MTFRLSQLEEMAHWCSTCAELTTERQKAWRTYFGEDDPKPVRYWPGAADATSKQRRFLGWFMFTHTLSDGQKPAQVAADLFGGRVVEEARRAVQNARYVLAIVSSVLPGRGVFLELEEERFEVRSRALSRLMTRGLALVAHLVPSRPGLWIPGPGWLEWPIAIGPNIRRDLKRFQLDPISLERLLQSRFERPEEAARVEYPREETLEEAVARMTETARAEGKTRLILTSQKWKHLVLKHLDEPEIVAFGQEVIERVGEVKDREELNRWLALATNIWNATPQPDRSGRTAYEISKEELPDREPP